MSRLRGQAPRCGRAYRRRGTATFEAVAALPFFALILAALMHVGGRAHERQAMSNDARACAFLYASRGCKAAASMPAHCQALLGYTEAEPGEPVALSAQVETPIPADALETVREIPLLGGVVENLVGKPVRAQQVTDSPVPTLLGGGSLRLEAHQDVLCSSIPSHDNLPATLFRSLTGH